MRQIGTLGAAGHHDVGIAQRDEARCVADGVRAGGAGGDDGVVRTLEVVLDRDVAGGKIDQPAGNEERRDAPRALLLQEDRGVGDAREAADARADQDAGRLLLLGRIGLPARVGHGLVGGGHGVDDEVVDLALLLGLHPVVGIELAVDGGASRDEAGDLAGEIGDVELLDAARTALAGKEIAPRRLDAATDWSDQTKARDDDAAHALPDPLRLRSQARSIDSGYW